MSIHTVLWVVEVSHRKGKIVLFTVKFIVTMHYLVRVKEESAGLRNDTEFEAYPM